jgi:hypothetical protein
MIEAIILSIFSFIVGGLVGALSTMSLLDSDIKRMVLNSGKRLYMWKGFVDPTTICVSTAEPDGDGVIFDKNGNIIFIDKHETR